MFGDCLKGILFTALLGFAFLGIATVIPDSVWDQAPPRLIPVRTYLADRGVINEKYASAPPAGPSQSPASADSAGDRQEDYVCEDGICRLKGREEGDAPAKPVRPNFVPLASADSLAEHAPAPVREDIPAPKPLPSENPESFVPQEDPAFIPEQPFSDSDFGDTLPDLDFGEDPFPEEDFPVPAQTEDSVVRGAEQDPGQSGYRKSTPIKPVNHLELQSESQALPPSRAAEPAGEPSLHEQIASLVARSEGPGAISASFLRLNEILSEHDADLSESDRELLNKTLDRLAYRIFYQPGEFVLWEEYTARPQETLVSIARDHSITPEFLAAINGIRQRADEPLPAGKTLKVVEGPVSAEVSLSKMELLLKFNGLYAGRFKMGCAQRAEQVRGEFSVVRKIKNPEYNGPLADGQIGRIAGGDPRNPLGPYWIELEGGLGLQGTNRDEYIGQRTASVGGLIFSNKDINHLNILLTQGAKVRVTD